MTESNETTATVAEARAWLKENGHTVGDRGFLSADHKATFTEGTGRQVASAK